MKKITTVLLFTLLAMGMVFAQGSAEPGAPKAAKTELVYAQSVPITSLEITGMQPQAYPAAYETAFAIFNGLVRFTPSMEIVPDLAESWSTSANGLDWIFKLKKNVTFQDGYPFNADAVVAHVMRMVDGKTNVGALTLWNPVKEAVKIDDHTVRISTHAPYGGYSMVRTWLRLYSSPTAVKTDERHGFIPWEQDHTNSTHSHPYRRVLVANVNYFGVKPATRSLPTCRS
jgi:ABC-type transport system substrate-binding protein